MNDSTLWLSASLACLLSLSLLSTAACLFLIRRSARSSRTEHLNEQRLIQLSLEVRRLEQRVRELEGPQARGPGSDDHEPAPSLISVPDMKRRADGQPDEAPPSPTTHEDARAMAQRGLSAAEIARATGRPIGQVEIILRLQQQYQQPRATKNAGEHAETT